MLEAAALESEFRDALRARMVEEIHRREMDVQSLASALGMLPSGAESLLERDDWSLETVMRVASALGLRVRPVAEPA